jgi:hypothetical protein
VIAGSSIAASGVAGLLGASHAGRRRGDINKAVAADTAMPSASVVTGHGVVKRAMHKK